MLHIVLQGVWALNFFPNSGLRLTQEGRQADAPSALAGYLTPYSINVKGPWSRCYKIHAVRAACEAFPRP